MVHQLLNLLLKRILVFTSLRATPDSTLSVLEAFSSLFVARGVGQEVKCAVLVSNCLAHILLLLFGQSTDRFWTLGGGIIGRAKRMLME